MKRTTITASLLLVGVLLAGCQVSKIRTPSGFVEVDSYRHEFRAVSPEGVTLAYRTQENPKDGTLAFWTKAIKRTLVEQKGHQFQAEEELTSTSGMSGILLKCSKLRSGTQFDYWVAVYLAGSKLHVVDAGGKTADFQAYQADILKSMRSL